ncbi:MAG: hypothetical protein AAGI28_03650 [Pseudomonadota bacterium]
MEESAHRKRLKGRAYSSQWPDSEPIVLAGQRGETEGVFVDFTHSSFPEGDWEARHWWKEWCAQDNEVRLVFPSEAGINLDSVARLMPDLAGRRRIFVAKGDAIRIESVEPKEIGGMFDHPQDTLCHLASILVVRSNGDEERPECPLTFFGTTQVRDAPPNEIYDRLIERVTQDHGPPAHGESLGGFINPSRYKQERFEDLGKRAQLAAQEAERALEKLRQNADERQLALIARLASAAALSAFMQAKHELRVAERQAVGSAGGRAHGPAAQRDDDAIAFAKEVWSRDPQRRRKSIAREIAEHRHGEVDDNVVRSLMRTLRPYDPHAK